jgi:hypothetical protein
MNGGMMKAAAIASLVFATACVDGIGEEPADPTTPLTATVLSGVPGHKLVIATGGAATLRIEDKRALGLEGNASQGYAVTPTNGNVWPHIAFDYFVHANVSGAGSYEIITSRGIATGLVHSAPIATTKLLPFRYELAGETFALAPNRTQVEVALLDAQGQRLVDGTLAFSNATQTDWDRATVAATAGRHTLTVAGDSVTAEFDVEVIDGVERVERVRVGNRTCFHAYVGSTEVAIAMSFERGTQDPNATNCATASQHASPDDVRAVY